MRDRLEADLRRVVVAKRDRGRKGEFRDVNFQQFHFPVGIVERHLPLPKIGTRAFRHADITDALKQLQRILDDCRLGIAVNLPGCLPIVGQGKSSRGPIIRDRLNTLGIHADRYCSLLGLVEFRAVAAEHLDVFAGVTESDFPLPGIIGTGQRHPDVHDAV